MTIRMHIEKAGPAMTVQDMGRQGYLAYGLTRGGAADMLALHEGAALLGQSPEHAAIEMVGMGGTFAVDSDTVIALTGAKMAATIGGAPVVWNASHSLPAGAKLVIGGAQAGSCGYLHVAGGFATAEVMGARSTHLTAGIGTLLQTGNVLPLGTNTSDRSGYFIEPENRLTGGDIRIVASVQTQQFSDETLARFEETAFQRDARGNRQGVRMASQGEGFFAEGGLSIVSEVISEGDIQITGDGAPYVLMCECQTTGGYPRIGTVIPADLPCIAQAPVGAPLTFRFVTLEEAREIELKHRSAIKTLPGQVQPLVRNLNGVADLLGYQLIGGAVSALADPFDD
mgnify:CR=1 FL=1